MFSKTKLSLSRINYKLFVALLVLGLAPTIYTTVRMFFLGQLPGEYSFSIAGQLSWVNLLYEILNEAIILPLFYFVGKVKNNKVEFSNRVRSGMLITLGVYAVLSFVMIVFAQPLLKLMATDVSIIEASISYNGDDCENGKYCRRTGNVLGGKQLYLGLASSSSASAWRVDQARCGNRQRKYLTQLCWLFQYHGNHLGYVVCEHSRMETVYDSRTPLY